MKAGMSFEAMLQNLDNRVKRDFTASRKSMTMTLEPKESGLEPKMEIAIRDRDTNTITPTTFGISRTGHRQLGSNLGIPSAYYDRMMAAAPELLQHNVNHWLQDSSDSHLVRTLNGNMRAVLSPSFRIFDCDELLAGILPTLEKMNRERGLRLVSTNLTDESLYIKGYFTDTELEGEVKKGDIVRSGFCLRNGEIGNSSVVIQGLIYRVWCDNGAITERGMRKRHAGRRTGAVEDSYELFRDETIEADNRALIMKITDLLTSTADPAFFQTELAKMQEATEIAVEALPMIAVERVQQRFKLSETESAGILTALEVMSEVEKDLMLTSTGKLSQWGLVNAVTRYSQKVEDYDRATWLEELGGKLLNLPQRELVPILRAA